MAPIDSASLIASILNSSVYCRLGRLLSCNLILRTGEVSNFWLYVKSRQGHWTDVRTCRTSLADDAMLLDEIRAQIAELPTYGYRRGCALVNRQRAVAESEPLFEDDIYFAAPVGSRYATLAEVDLADCAQERFVTLSEGFVTYVGFVDAFRVAGFTTPRGHADRRHLLAHEPRACHQSVPLGT
jgi:hypothetical protein